jgi:HSP20 family molecular chaperone IbpA
MAHDAEITKKETSVTESLGTRREILPHVDIFEHDNELMLKADIPGVRKEDIEINFEKDELTIFGKGTPSEQDTWNATTREFATADYRRSFRVGKGIDVEKISAEFNDGVLTLHLPKSEALKPRQIKVQSG